MVKGVTRRVIVVKSPDPRLFEQAIFILRESVPNGQTGVTADQVLLEARQAAAGYIRRNRGPGRWLGRIPGPAYAVGGALVATLLWAFALIFPL